MGRPPIIVVVGPMPSCRHRFGVRVQTPSSSASSASVMKFSRSLVVDIFAAHLHQLRLRAENSDELFVQHFILSRRYRANGLGFKFSTPAFYD